MKTLEKIFNNFNYSNIVEIVKIIRTVFQDYKEDFLDICFSQGGIDIYVKFIDTKLQFYSETKTINNKYSILLKYFRGNKIDFSVIRSDKSTDEFDDIILTKSFNEFVSIIKNLIKYQLLI